MIAMTDRLAETPANPPAPSRRSPAQIDASRRNGAKSKGPRTPAGKARSRMNAVKHGILARKIVPLADGRHEDREYQLLLDGLAEDYQPQSTGEWTWLEILAHDFVHLGRIKQLQETIMVQQSTGYEDKGASRRYVLDLEQHVADLDGILEQLQRGPRLACDGEVLAWLAPMIREWAEDLQEEGECLKQELQAGNAVEDEDRQKLELFEQIGPAELLGEDAHLQAVLLGKEPIIAGQRQRWALLIQGVRAIEHGRLWFTRKEQAAFDEAYRKHQAQLLERLPAMEVLQRYETTCRRSIERTMRLLEDRRQQRASSSGQ